MPYAVKFSPNRPDSTRAAYPGLGLYMQAENKSLRQISVDRHHLDFSDLLCLGFSHIIPCSCIVSAPESLQWNNCSYLPKIKDSKTELRLNIEKAMRFIVNQVYVITTSSFMPILPTFLYDRY